MESSTILAIGSINADFQVRTARRITAGDTFLASEFVRLSGGKAANVAFLAHRLGYATTLIGRVGDDDLAEQALANLRRFGVPLTNVTVAPQASTAVAMIAVAPDGNKTIVLANNANDIWDSRAVHNAIEVIMMAPEKSILVIDLEIASEVVQRCVSAAKTRSFKVVLDPAPPDRFHKKLLSQCDAITPNAQEASVLTGVDATSLNGAAQAAVKLASIGSACVCVKLLEGGCIVANGSTLLHVPAVPVKVVDATGAGDAFACAFAVYTLEGKSIDEAAVFGTAAAHLAVTSYGSQESYPDRRTIEDFAKAFRVERLDAKDFA